MNTAETSAYAGVLAEFRQQRQASAIKIARWIFSAGVIGFIPFLAPSWMAGELQLAFNLEFLTLAIGMAALWLIGDDKPGRGAQVLVTTFGLMTLFALVQFGPNMGVGVLSVAWLLTISGLLGRSWLGAILLSVSYGIAGVVYLQGLIGADWYMTMTFIDWARSWMLVAMIYGGIALILDRINREFAEAWQREAAAVTERAEAERALLQAQRLESIGRLAGGVAHDFNNSLTVMIGGIDALRLTEPSVEREQLMNNMEQAVNAAVATTNQLLSLSRQGLEPGQPGKPKVALEALVPNLKRLLPETITIDADLQDTPPVALTNGDLEQIVLNLCLNARDAMPTGGRISISCRHASEQVFLVVRDTGEGMDQDTQQRALGAFFTTKSTGTGLGLAMVQDKLDSVDGGVSVNSEPGLGTTITLVMPALDQVEEEAEPEVEPEPPPAKPRKGIARGGESVLLVEDDHMVLEMFSEVLRLGGYRVTPASCIEEALVAIDSQPTTGSFDIMVTDAVLPDGEPSRAIARFRAGGWKPVLVCSGYIDSDQLVQDIAESDYEFLQKPFPNAQLLEVVAGLLNREPASA